MSKAEDLIRDAKRSQLLGILRSYQNVDATPKTIKDALDQAMDSRTATAIMIQRQEAERRLAEAQQEMQRKYEQQLMNMLQDMTMTQTAPPPIIITKKDAETIGLAPKPTKRYPIAPQPKPRKIEL